MIACQKAFTPEVRLNDDYEQFLREFAVLVEEKYRDSLVLAGMSEAEDEDFRRRRWKPAFVARLVEFVTDHGDGSAGCLSLSQALHEGELRSNGNTMLVWLGPAARQWLRERKRQLGAFLGSRYLEAVRHL